MRKLAVGLAISLVVVACDKDPVGPLLPAPQNLFYELEPSGDPDLPLGILLFWDLNTDPNLDVYRVYSRAGANESFGLRGETTSPTFHDGGQPDLEYFVVAVDFNGIESAPSTSVIVDERLRLESPTVLLSTSLNGAIHLAWSDNAFQTTPSAFKQYRVYSATYSLDDDLCGASWGLEGTTVAPEFIAGALPNGAPRCFGVSAESIEGYESLWSPIRADTPRPDARNVVVTAMSFDVTRAGFRFWLDGNSDGQVGALELGIVADGNRTDIDFRVTRDVNGDFFLVPVRQNTVVAQYGTGPVDDLTSIDIAPETGYSPAAIQALSGYGYVFAMDAGDQFARFGALRVTHVGRDYIIFDWSYQTDPGNPELSVGAGFFTGGDGGVVVKR
ncbi:MAG: hypothetical protein OEO20_16240 [Gemmatimonadota bacterium]|nr:hypothetical protein [Gemmatimonadota bacterium]MDH3368619.1 hypothetical protein [Gemmatimonadota bacterium]MDH3479846.1 hypothetical protein [Gemmatimonadota bacterium]MDH3570670.1 hypothetical protein [Gemmatimonadota bacterium]MDH5549464.1 hypothetical protein [Gemmatimonadota bacterium]